jgi:hypothetical protein
LFERTSRRVTATGAGEAVVFHARRVMAELIPRQEVDQLRGGAARPHLGRRSSPAQKFIEFVRSATHAE